MKICTLCKEEKPVTAFGKHSQKKDGLSSWCKPCANSKAKERNACPARKKHKKQYDEKHSKKPEVMAKRKQQRVERYRSNAEMHKHKIREWQKANPEKVTMYKKNNKYRRREIVNKSNLTTKELKEWEETQLKSCCYCNADCEDDYQIDHIDPLSNGGEHALDNLAISCPTCNRRKSATTLLI